MNKKQAGIILTLLALIVCAGILAAKVNSPLETAMNTESGSDVFSFNKSDKSSSTSTDYFTSAKLERQQSNAMVLASYQSVMDNKNIPESDRSEAAKKHMAKTTRQDQELTIEENLKAKGFEDAVCFITDDKVRVVVKAKEVSAQQRKQIQDVATGVSKLSNVEIQLKE